MLRNVNNSIHTNLNLKNIPRVIYKYLLFKQHNINVNLYQHLWLSSYFLKTVSLHKKDNFPRSLKHIFSY